MPLESASYVNGLNSSNPAHTDAVNQGDAHLRLIKAALIATFPNLAAAMNATAAQLNQLIPDGSGHTVFSGRVIGNGTMPVGSIHAFPADPGTTIVARGGTATGVEQFIECDGSTYPSVKFPDLAASPYVTVAGSNFTVPQLNDTGRFLRARSTALSYVVGASQANQNQSHTHTASDAGHNHTASSSDSGHTHTASDSGHVHGPENPYTNFMYDGAGSVAPVGNLSAGSNVQHNSQTGTGFANITVAAGVANITTTVATGHASITVNSQGGAEARPEAFVVVYCLKT